MPRRILSIPKHERQAAIRLFAYSTLVAGSYTATRTSADSLFLSRIGNENLANVFIVSGITTAILASVWVWFTEKLPLVVVLRASGLILATLSIVAWALLPEFHHEFWLLAAVYLLAEIKGSVGAINVVASMNEILGGHSSRYSWAAIGLGAPIAGMVVGTFIGLEAEIIGLRDWLLCAAIIDILAVFPSAPSTRHRVPDFSKPENRIVDLERPRETLRKKNYTSSSKFRFWIGALISMKVVVLTIITYEWKISVNDFYEADEASLARYFGIFYAAIGALTLLVQALITGKLLTRHGIVIPVLLMPIAFVILNSIYLFTDSTVLLFGIMTLAKSFEVWRRSVHDTTLNLLYTNIEREKRRRAIAFNKALVKPLSEVVASLILIVGAGLWSESLALSIAGIWLYATCRLLQLIRQTRKSTHRKF